MKDSIVKKRKNKIKKKERKVKELIKGIKEKLKMDRGDKEGGY